MTEAERLTRSAWEHALGIDAAARPADDRMPGVDDVTVADEVTYCAECAAKPGSPTLCRACLRNRTLIAVLKARAALNAAGGRPFRTTSCEGCLAEMAGIRQTIPHERPPPSKRPSRAWLRCSVCGWDERTSDPINVSNPYDIPCPKCLSGQMQWMYPCLRPPLPEKRDDASTYVTERLGELSRQGYPVSSVWVGSQSLSDLMRDAFQAGFTCGERRGYAAGQTAIRDVIREAVFGGAAQEAEAHALGRRDGAAPERSTTP